MRSGRLAILVLVVGWPAGLLAGPGDRAPVLPSWSDGKAKQALLRFVRDVTDPRGPRFVNAKDRIAVFDNDGTLWVERPMYAQVRFTLDTVRELGKIRPEFEKRRILKTFLKDSLLHLGKVGSHEIEKLGATSLAGLTQQEHEKLAKQWLASTIHPRFRRPYRECVYQPMLELLAYLRANGFQTWVCSGGGTEFIRCLAEDAYGIGPQQVIGTAVQTRFELRDGKPVLVRQAQLVSPSINGAGKPVGIARHIGKKPILAFGNSDGDLPMLQYTDTGTGPRLMLLLHHDDARREYAYDRKAHIGRLDKALDEAGKRGWTVVSMKRDFKVVFPPPRR